MHYFYVLFALTFSAVVIFGEKPRRHAIQQVQNFESTFYSEHSGFPFLKIFYKEASSSRPKLGFLKFRISFLKVEELKIKLDLRHASSAQLLNMWHELMSQRAIRYATLEPITLTLVNQKGKIFDFHAPKGKFTSTGELQLRGKVFYSVGPKKEAFERIHVVMDESLNALVVRMNLNDPDPLVFPFTKR